MSIKESTNFLPVKGSEIMVTSERERLNLRSQRKSEYYLFSHFFLPLPSTPRLVQIPLIRVSLVLRPFIRYVPRKERAGRPIPQALKAKLLS